MTMFGDLIDSIEGLDDEFEERPAELEDFISTGYLELDRGRHFVLSDYQKDIIEHSTQIYKLETLVRMYGEKEGKRRHARTKREVICMLGKGSGKDLMAEISCAYLVHKLLCLKDPSAYFGKPPDDAIDIVNVAVNADQAQRVFFKGFTNMIKNSPWFKDKVVSPKQRVYEFAKSVSVHSGHSEMEAFEGLNTIMVILDEISGFSMQAAASSIDSEPPAEAIYNMYRASLTSRFSQVGKLILLSWPRSKNDFISSRYNEVVAEKHIEHKTVELAVNPELPLDTPGNRLVIEWSEDHIIHYTQAKVWALRRPSWEVNPEKRIEEYIDDFYRNYRDSLGRYAAEPTEGAEGFFSDHEAITNMMTAPNGMDEEDWTFRPGFKPRKDREYFIHVDLAKKHDRAVVAMAHIDRWTRQQVEYGDLDLNGHVIVDAVRWWTPTREQQIRFTDIKTFIMELRRRGFNIKLITFDQWQSSEMIDYFNKIGIRAELLSVGLKHYNDFKLAMIEERVSAPYSVIFERELQQLKLTKNGNNVDHPNTKEGSKDIADAVCGAVYNALNRAIPEDAENADAVTIEDLRRRAEERERNNARVEKELKKSNVISAPQKNIPDEEDEWVVRVL